MANRYVLWGWTSRWSGVTRPLPITEGTTRDCVVRQRQFLADYPDALTGVCLAGNIPAGLADRVQQRLNPTDPTTDDTDGCEGHVDTDDALLCGAGIGEPVYCDGSCNPKEK